MTRIKLPADRRERSQIAGAAALIVVAFAVLNVPVGWIAPVGGWVRDAEGNRLLPALCFVVGSGCLAAAVWSAAVSVSATKAQRPMFVVLAVVSVAVTGGVVRFVLQLAISHRFYVHGSSSAATYWGLMSVLAAVGGSVLPLVVAVTCAVPRTFLLQHWRPRLDAVAGHREFLVLPIVAAAMIVTVNSLLPAALRHELGYSAPTVDGGRLDLPLTVVNRSVMDAFSRAAFLPLLVGMWEGMESANTFTALAGRWRRQRVFDVVAGGLCAAAAVAAAVLLSRDDPWLVPAALVLSGVVVLSTIGHLGSFFATPTLATLAGQTGAFKEWRSAAPIGMVLIVLAAPVAWPLGVDLWRGEAPFRLPSDVSGYVHFWRAYGIQQVPFVSIDGVFGHGMGVIAEYSGVLFVLVILGAVVSIITGDGTDGLGVLVVALLRVGGIAVALLPVIAAADRPTAALVLAAASIPALLLTGGGTEELRRVLLALGLLGAWAYVIWHAVWLPLGTVLAATIVRRFGFGSRELNNGSDAERVRGIAGFAALALLGLGLLVLDRGGREGVLASTEFSDITDRIALTVVAPLWLVHRAVASRRARDDVVSA